MPNPFKPTFGAPPPVLVGRAELLDLVDEAIEDGPGAPGRIVLYTGARGVGKTVLLSEVEERARRQGWLVVSETAVPGLVERLVSDRLPRAMSEFDAAGPRRALSGLGVAGVGQVNFEVDLSQAPGDTLRSRLTAMTDTLATHQTGVLITLDELHRSGAGTRLHTELRELFAVLQHLVREEREVMFAGAALPSAVEEVLADDALTFLRRADRHVLGLLTPAEAAQALRETITGAGRSIGEAPCRTAAEASGGYPFLVQLIGYHLWRQHPQAAEITAADVAVAVPIATRRLGALVHEPAIRDVSEVGQRFLRAMALDDGPSRLRDLAERLRVDGNYAGQYRVRLLAAGVIRPAGRGRVDFALPYLREYLRTQLPPS